MNSKLTFATLVLLVAGVFVPTEASAYGLHFCNKTSASIDVAVGIITDSPNSSQDKGVEAFLVEGVDYVRTFGWYTLAPGTCKTPIGQPLRTSTAYYYWADDSNGKTWDGDLYMCVYFGHAFDYDTTEAATDCLDEQRYKFNKIDTQTYNDYTYTFYPSN